MDSRDAHIAAYEAAFGRYGVPFPEQARRLVFQGASRKQVLKCAAVPAALSSEISRAKHETLIGTLRAGALSPSDETRRFLRTLKHAGCPAAVVSNSMIARPWIEAAKLEWAFAAVVDGALAPVPKPSPTGFLMAANLLNVPIDECVAVEDSPNGVAAARSAGSFVVGLGDRVPEADVDLAVTNLSDIPLDSWLGLI